MVCMRMGLENMADSIVLLRDKYQELIGRLGAQLPGCGVISRTEFYDHGLVGYRVCNFRIARYLLSVRVWRVICDSVNNKQVSQKYLCPMNSILTPKVNRSA